MLARKLESSIGLERDEALWYKYCIEPLAKAPNKKRRAPPCFREEGEMRFGPSALNQYLLEEIELEGSFV